MFASAEGVETALKRLAVSIFAMLCLHAAWRLTDAVRNQPKEVLGVPSPAAFQGLKSAVDAEQVAHTVAAQHLFGRAGAMDQPQSKTSVRTTGPVKVLGIIFANDPQLSRAILAVDDKQKSYSLGAQLTNGDKVVSIEADRVILADGDKRYALVLKHPGSAMLAKAPHFNGGGAVRVAVAPNPPRSTASIPAPSPAPVVSGTTLQRLQALRARLLSGGNG